MSCPELRLFLIVLALIMAKNYARKGAIWLFCKFEIIPDDMGNNGAYLILDYSCCHKSLCLAFEKYKKEISPTIT
jgi:hypothetical protein